MRKPALFSFWASSNSSGCSRRHPGVGLGHGRQVFARLNLPGRDFAVLGHCDEGGWQGGQLFELLQPEVLEKFEGRSENRRSPDRLETARLLDQIPRHEHADGVVGVYPPDRLNLRPGNGLPVGDYR